MQTQSYALKVCVCGAASESATMLLHAIAAGDILGNTQSLWLMLHDASQKTADLEEQAACLNDACYPLLTGVTAESCPVHSMESSDVIVILLQTVGFKDTLELIALYAAALNKVPQTKQKVVIIAGEQATTAAGVLCVLTPQLTRRLVLSVDIPNYSTQHKGSRYHAVKRFSECIHTWWTGQESGTVIEGANVANLPNCRHLPLKMRGPQLLQINASLSPDWKTMEQIISDFNVAVKQLQISEEELVASVLSCKL